MLESQAIKGSITSAMPSEGSPSMITTSSHVPPQEMHAHSDDIAMSHIEGSSRPDSVDGEDSQSETRGNAKLQNHEDTQTGLTALERLLNKLNSATILNHMDTGSSLRWANSYQVEQSGPPEDHHQVATDTGNEEASEVDSSQRIQNNEGDAVSPSSAQTSTSQSNQQPRAVSNTQPGIPRTIPNPYYSGIHYHRILVCVSIFVLGFQVLFALALGGVFGDWGYLLASVFLVVLLAVSCIVVIDGVRQRMWEIKMDTTKT